MFNYIYSLALDKRNDIFSKLIKSLLFFLSLFYTVIIRFIRYINLKKKYRFSCKVISVGNIVLGGTGKTVLVEYIASFLKKQKRQVAILSRGYAKGQNLTDEPNMLRQKLDIPVIVDKDRKRGISKAIEDYKIDTAIIDDGFQQWQIKKDLEILTLDARNPFGNGRLIPRGILRESLDGLKRAEVVVLTKTNLNPHVLDLKIFLKEINPKIHIFEADYLPVGFYKIGEKELVDSSFFMQKRVILLSGIADPNFFKDIILSLGIEVEAEIRFPDHYCYKRKDIESIRYISKTKKTNLFVTTEKDAVKIANFDLSGIDIFALRISLKIKDEEVFHERISSIYNS
ncbi:MAG: tetraacyldisaccharide 4'-kinase [Candidatus Omnitrophica bacterium]|nr:tetraacyldisaccharide 4'-kinase [Candidatus Omnitrophota bacterium]